MGSDIANTNNGRPETSRLVAPEWPIAISFEHLVKSETLLRVEERANYFAPSDFVASLEHVRTIITARGKGAVFGKKREFRNASGLPILEQYKSFSKMQGTWHVEIPGRSRKHLLEIDLHGLSGGKASLAVRFANRCTYNSPLVGSAALDMSSPAVEIFNVQGRDAEGIAFDVLHLGVQVARIERLVPKHISSTGTQSIRVWAARVAANVDLTIVGLIPCHICYVLQYTHLILLDNREHRSSGRHSLAATFCCRGCSSRKWVRWDMKHSVNQLKDIGEVRRRMRSFKEGQAIGSCISFPF